MRFVKELPKLPNRCAFYPQIGSGHEQGFIVPPAGQAFDQWDNRLEPAVSIVALRDIAEKFPEVGLCRRDDLTLALAELELLRNENEDLKAQMAEYDKELDAIQVLKARGYSPAKKPGRKPTPKPN